VHKDAKGLAGKRLRLELVPICTSILVTGLKKETSDDTIQLYFENEKRGGGKDVSKMERKGKDEVLVHFEDPSSKNFKLIIENTKAVSSKIVREQLACTSATHRSVNYDRPDECNPEKDC